MNAVETEKVIYPLLPLIEVFTEALDTKTAKVATYAGFGAWAQEHPAGNTKSEQLTVDWLKAQQSNGLTRIETKFPIGDFFPLSKFEHSLSWQIKNNWAQGIK